MCTFANPLVALQGWLWQDSQTRAIATSVGHSEKDLQCVWRRFIAKFELKRELDELDVLGEVLAEGIREKITPLGNANTLSNVVRSYKVLVELDVKLKEVSVLAQPDVDLSAAQSKVNKLLRLTRNFIVWQLCCEDSLALKDRDVFERGLNKAYGSENTTFLSQVHLAFGKEMVSAKRCDGFMSLNNHDCKVRPARPARSGRMVSSASSHQSSRLWHEEPMWFDAICICP